MRNRLKNKLFNHKKAEKINENTFIYRQINTIEDIPEYAEVKKESSAGDTKMENLSEFKESIKEALTYPVIKQMYACIKFFFRAMLKLSNFTSPVSILISGFVWLCKDDKKQKK